MVSEITQTRVIRMSQWLYVLAVAVFSGLCWAYARIEAYLAIRRMVAEIRQDTAPDSRPIQSVRLHALPARKRAPTYLPGRSSG